MPAPAGNPFHEHIPRQALALAGWAGFWTALEALLRALGMGARGQGLVFLAVLAAAGAAGLLARPWLFRLFTSVRFAVTQGAFLCAAVALGLAANRIGGPGRGEAVFLSLWFCALLAVLAASMLAVTWKRRPYTLARLGFLLVHVAPSLILLGTLGQRLAAPAGFWLVQAGGACLVIGCAWMFYLKPWLKRRESRP
ncbi:MAG: hypothetical protein P4L36_21560 [Holophaga sp.]|nr:hypothetical protein [Holophaga sp.]